MIARKFCRLGARATCPYGDHRCPTHPWHIISKFDNKTYPAVNATTYAAQRGALVSPRTKKDALVIGQQIDLDWRAGRDPRKPPHPVDGRTLAALLTQYQAVALDRLKVHLPVKSELRHIREYFADQSVRVVSDEAVVRAFKQALLDGWRPPVDGTPQALRPRGPVAVNRILQRLRNFVRWCMAQQAEPPILVHSPFHDHGVTLSDEAPRVRRLHEGEEAALIAACKATNDLDHRWAGGALERRILAALELGLRGTELDRILTTDIDWKQWTVTVRAGKSQIRVLSIDPEGALATAIAPRRFLKAPHHHVFGNEAGVIVEDRTGWETVVLLAHGKIAADGQGRDEHQAAKDFKDIALHFHDFRRECASRWYFERGIDIVTVSRWLGHATIRMTQVYLGLPQETGLAADMATQLGHKKVGDRPGRGQRLNVRV